MFSCRLGFSTKGKVQQPTRVSRPALYLNRASEPDAQSSLRVVMMYKLRLRQAGSEAHVARAAGTMAFQFLELGSHGVVIFARYC